MNRLTFNVIIAGSRDFNDYELLKSKCIFLLQDKMKQCNVQIVCGCARGVDILGKQFAEEFGLKALLTSCICIYHISIVYLQKKIVIQTKSTMFYIGKFKKK